MAGLLLLPPPPLPISLLLLPLLLLLEVAPPGVAAPAAPGRSWSYHLLDDTDSSALCLDGSPGAFDHLPASSPPPAGPPPPPRCQLAHGPSGGTTSTHFSYFIKTGGDLAVLSGWDNRADKCCRQSEHDCRWYMNVDNATALAACESALRDGGGHCVPCPSHPNSSDANGCPDWSSPPAPGQVNATTSWQIHLAGGGWCYNGTDCAGRTKSYLGSSTLFNRSHVPTGGLLSADAAENPRFSGWHKVQVRYCDGFSFTGDRDAPVVVALPGGGGGGNKSSHQRLFVRGRRVLRAALQALLPLGLADAEHVMLTGDSAGGLAVFHATDFIGAFLHGNAPNLQTYKAAPVSGFFLDHVDVTGVPQYASALATAFTWHNASAGVNSDCVAVLGPRCFFAQNAWAWVSTAPLFAVNSAMDLFQTLCILTGKVYSGGCSGIAGWHDCRFDLNNCSALQMAAMRGFEVDFIKTFGVSLEAAQRKQPELGHSGFLYSCHNHCAADSVLFDRITVAGVTVQAAVTTWWDGAQPAAAAAAAAQPVVQPPCLWAAAGTERRCNPTCYSPGDL